MLFHQTSCMYVQNMFILAYLSAVVAITANNNLLDVESYKTGIIVKLNVLSICFLAACGVVPECKTSQPHLGNR